MKLPRNPINGWIVASVPAPINDRVSKHIYQGWRPCIEWCAETFGEMRSPDSPSRWRFIGEGVFEFRRADDHMMFLLRWA